MPARQRLNADYFQGSLFLAALIGWGCSSWAVFVTALVVLLAGNLLAGDIRPTMQGRKQLTRSKNQTERNAS